jgi:hypothetical protein
MKTHNKPKYNSHPRSRIEGKNAAEIEERSDEKLKRASIFYGANLGGGWGRNMKNKQITMLARQLLFFSISFLHGRSPTTTMAAAPQAKVLPLNLRFYLEWQEGELRGEAEILFILLITLNID